MYVHYITPIIHSLYTAESLHTAHTRIHSASTVAQRMMKCGEYKV